MGPGEEDTCLDEGIPSCWGTALKWLWCLGFRLSPLISVFLILLYSSSQFLFSTGHHTLWATWVSLLHLTVENGLGQHLLTEGQTVGSFS